MADTSYEEICQFEHCFWLQILGDHSRFIYFALSPNEFKSIETAQKFIDAFDQLLSVSRQPLNADEWANLSAQAVIYANNLRDFKLYLIKKLLLNKLRIHFTPTFLNHMVNELEEYSRILPYLTRKQIPPKSHVIHHHLLWLADASGHADAISSSLDATETVVRNKSDAFVYTFNHFYIKAVEMAGYLRTSVTDFPALRRFNTHVDLEMAIFRDFLREIRELELSNELLDTFSPLMADHMSREECYYLIKLAESSGTEPPDCDPTQPRVEQG